MVTVIVKGEFEITFISVVRLLLRACSLPSIDESPRKFIFSL